MKAVEAYYRIRDQQERDDHKDRYGIVEDDYESVNVARVSGLQIVAQVQN